MKDLEGITIEKSPETVQREMLVFGDIDVFPEGKVSLDGDVYHALNPELGFGTGIEKDMPTLLVGEAIAVDHQTTLAYPPRREQGNLTYATTQDQILTPFFVVTTTGTPSATVVGELESFTSLGDVLQYVHGQVEIPTFIVHGKITSPNPELRALVSSPSNGPGNLERNFRIFTLEKLTELEIVGVVTNGTDLNPSVIQALVYPPHALESGPAFHVHGLYGNPRGQREVAHVMEKATKITGVELNIYRISRATHYPLRKS